MFIAVSTPYWIPVGGCDQVRHSLHFATTDKLGNAVAASKLHADVDYNIFAVH